MSVGFLSSFQWAWGNLLSLMAHRNHRKDLAGEEGFKLSRRNKGNRRNSLTCVISFERGIAAVSNTVESSVILVGISVIWVRA